MDGHGQSKVTTYHLFTEMSGEWDVASGQVLLSNSEIFDSLLTWNFIEPTTYLSQSESTAT